MELKSSVQIFNEAGLSSVQGIARGQTLKTLAGSPEHPTERIRVVLATFKPGTNEKIHWHPVETFHYVLAGRAVLTDIEGNTHEMTPGTVIYTPAGITGSHSWEVKETLQLMTVRATTDSPRTIQFDVDLDTKESSVSLDHLVKKRATTFKSFY